VDVHRRQRNAYNVGPVKTLGSNATDIAGYRARLGNLIYRERKPMPSILPSVIMPIRHSVKPFSNFTDVTAARADSLEAGIYASCPLGSA
jgi:hypothetical protein